MCGIAGIIHTGEQDRPPSIGVLRSMIGAIRHRGPDEFGMFRDAHAGLCHARLSILDVAAGQQPLSNETGSLWIVFNGEIFNHGELRKELELLGHRFRTRTDTEVIVHAYETWGDNCFEKFNGQWSLALWDCDARTLTLARDRVGVRPLYIHEQKGCIRFASEVKAIFADPAVTRAVDLHGLDQTFTYWASVAPVSLFRGIEELRAGFVRQYDRNGQKSERRFWTISYPTADQRRKLAGSALSLREATGVLESKLERATAIRMAHSDVPVGCYLSGGLDSSLIAWLGRRAHEGKFQTFSLRFEDAEFDETPYQRLMASALKSDHVEVMVSRNDVAAAFPDVIWHTERPILRTAPVPMFLLSESVQKAGVKVVLTGEGADEILAGYDIFREAKIRLHWSRRPKSQMIPILFERIYPFLSRSPQKTKGMALEFWRRGLQQAGGPGFSHHLRWWTTSSLKRFFTAEVRGALETNPAPSVLDDLPKDFGQWDPLCKAQYLEMTTLLSNYLLSSQGDRMLMAHSVEGRFPFLDPDVVEFCNSLPPAYKLNILNEKYLLKRVAHGKIPEEIIQRKKQPYRAPDAISFLGSNAPEYVAEMLSERSLSEAGLFDAKVVQALYRKCVQHARQYGGTVPFGNSDNMAFVGILSAQLMHHHFIRNRRSSDGQNIEFKTVIDRVATNSTIEHEVPVS
jgi:asparagine synthase (glutamine-hydrolysing)